MPITIPMGEKEIMEARKSGIPDNLIGKMSQGFELSEKEKNVVMSKGKVYVLGHTRYRGRKAVRPQIRDLPIGVKITREEKSRRTNQLWDKKQYEEDQVNEEYKIKEADIRTEYEKGKAPFLKEYQEKISDAKEIRRRKLAKIKMEFDREEKALQAITYYG